MAIVKVFEQTDSTLLQRFGPPCRRVLEEYKDVNLLNSFIHEIRSSEEARHLEVIPMDKIQGKAVHIQLENSTFDYVLRQPNTIS